MADGLAAPRDLRVDGSPMGRLAAQIRRFEVPDCRCPPAVLCMAGLGPAGKPYPARCAGRDACGVCPVNPNIRCPHVAAMRALVDAGGCPTAAQLEAMERLYDPEGFAERPPGPPRDVTTQALRLEVYAERAERGYALKNPLDRDACSDDTVAVRGGPGLAQEGPRASRWRGVGDAVADRERQLVAAGRCAPGELVAFVERRAITTLATPPLMEMQEGWRALVDKLIEEFARGHTVVLPPRKKAT